MRQYIWVIIIVVGSLLLTTIVISLCIIFYKSHQYRKPRRRMNTNVRVQPGIATPINVMEAVPDGTHLKPPRYFHDSLHAELSATSKSSTKSSPPENMMPSNNSIDRLSPVEKRSYGWATRAARSISAIDAPSKEAFGHVLKSTLRPKRSTQFVDRDPPSAESQKDYLNPLDIESLHQAYSESALYSKENSPGFGSVQCIYRQDRRYLHNVTNTQNDYASGDEFV